MTQRLKFRNNPSLIKQVETLNKILLKYNLKDLLELLSNPTRLLYLNFIAGLARGFGIALGLTFITALFLAILARIASLNLPVISRFIAEIIRLVEHQLSTLPR